MNHSLYAEGIPFGFVYTPEVVDPQGRVVHRGPPIKNLIPQVGVDHLAGLLRGQTALVSAWYVGVFEGNFVPGRSTTSADLQLSAQECLAYSETSRPGWDETYDGDSFISNLDSRVEYTFTTAKRIYGAFLVSDASKGGNSGVLLSIARFPSPLDLPVGFKLRLGVSIALLPLE